jgi:type II secretory pathway pseudopilin PulG
MPIREASGSRPRLGPVRLIGVAALVVIAGLGTATAYSLARSQLAAAVYLERLQALAADYENLREDFNTAVRRTAVTELLVAGNKLSVHIRTADGTTKTIPTPFDPRGEIYVDYAVVDGRLWLRRIFDAQTPPSQAMVIDPSFETVDWENTSAKYGKAIYRSLGTGRWVVSVTGDGSLGLEQVDPSEESTMRPLAFAPEVQDFETIEEQVQDRLDRIGWKDVIRRVFSAPGNTPGDAPGATLGASSRAGAEVPLD